MLNNNSELSRRLTHDYYGTTIEATQEDLGFDALSQNEIEYWHSFSTPYDELDTARGERFDDAPQ